MKHRTLLLSSLAVLLICAVAACFAAKPTQPDNMDGMQPTPDSEQAIIGGAGEPTNIVVDSTVDSDSLVQLQAELDNAVWFTPEDIHDIEYMELVYADGQRFTLSSEEGYDFVESFLSNATESMIPACPFDNVLFLHRADGVVGKILTASDGCWMIKSDEKYYRISDWDDPAYQANKEKYFSYFVPLGDRAIIDTPELPEPLKLEDEVQQAACDAILASLRTGWWLGGRTLDPAKEAAAFTCFHRETIGDEVNLYGFGGYFSQDAQSNAADEWSSFTIVTLNASTLDLIQVWWPGDSAYHDMSITENFPDGLAEAAVLLSPDDYQRLQTALRKQAAENMSPTHLE